MANVADRAKETTLSEEMIVECRENFALFDKDGDGKINESELAIVMCAVGLSPTGAELQELLRSSRVSNDRLIEFNTFCRMVAIQQNRVVSESDILDAFRVFDKKKDGTISSAEMRHVLTTVGEKLTEDEVDEMLREADIDASGMINYIEFVRMLMSSK
eukprot:TRINITY_DN3485_c0_g1_i1.p1 TRINITY_DN3485_c0_g1~~TRINITY_DN3485_c0_g1_i1.p1  ORF type:complete len:159 (+),score=59.30 TRINITY_DN3485_c0_g1_i1:150-626(+)